MLVATSEENAKDSKVGFSRLTITIKLVQSLQREWLSPFGIG